MGSRRDAALWSLVVLLGLTVWLFAVVGAVTIFGR